MNAHLSTIPEPRSHNSVITNIRILNRLCEKHNLPLVYDGLVSEDRPYRVEVADAVLSYVEQVVKNRFK